MLTRAGGVVTDQAEADEDTSLKNRALMAVGMLYSHMKIIHYTHEIQIHVHRQLAENINFLCYGKSQMREAV